MKKVNYTVRANYGYNPEHKGAPYFVEDKFFNFGNLCECAVSEWAGQGFGYDTKAVPFDKGSDIESINASVKSSGASLACLYGTSKEDIIDEYFNRVHSTEWIYVVEIDGEFNFYMMDANEFRAFLNEWATMARESDGVRFKVRFKKTSGKMIAWMDERVA